MAPIAHYLSSYLVHSIVLLASAAAAGMMNAMAGGGTIVTYPTLVMLGESPITANATSTVALLPGAAASLWGYRREVQDHREWLRTLLLPSVLGGAVGSVLLLRTPEHMFAEIVPLLILFATALFALQGMVSARFGDGAAAHKSAVRWTVASVYQFGVGIYGGYFGAGAGILMLAVLGFLGLRNIHAANGTKNFFGICINSVAAAYFIWRGRVDWPVAIVMIIGATAGGYGGARLARRIGQTGARRAVVIIGLLVTALLLIQQRMGH